MRTTHRLQYLVVITECFTKLVRTISLSGVTAAEVTKQFVNHWVLPYSSTLDLISDNGLQFLFKFLQAVCKILNVHNSFKNAYYGTTNC